LSGFSFLDAEGDVGKRICESRAVTPCSEMVEEACANIVEVWALCACRI